jgi:predicted ATPase/DNA-binding winged helix-turn-helix (wHTH) protein
MKQFECFGLDTLNECLWRNGLQIRLAPKPFAVLRYLVENPGRLITHDELLDALWPETYVQPQVLRTYMLELRKVLEDDAGQPRFIETLPKRGYRFVAAVTEGGSPDRRVAPGVVAMAANSVVIVGREEELMRLDALAELVSGGQRQVVFVTGGAGIGKTALVDEFRRRIRNVFPAMVTCGQGVDGLGETEAYYPVREALGQLCASSDGTRAREILARAAPAWLPLNEREIGWTDATGGGRAPQRSPGDLCGALEELTQQSVLVMVFEDLHWADDSTVDLISALARRRAPAKLMVLATYRPLDGSTEHPLKAVKQDLLMHRLCVEMALAPLTRMAMRELLSRELQQELLPSGLDGFVYQHSEGNPLFAIALLQHLKAQRVLVREGAEGGCGWEQRVPFPEMEMGVPDELAQLIELEIERLDPREQRTLEAASLMKVAFPAWAVAAALGQDAAETEEACDALARRLSFVHRAGHDDLPDGTRSDFYAFGHGLYREVLYHKQSAARRAKGHTRIAERLGEMFAGREGNVAREMAMHFEAAGNWQRAAAALRAAARYAQERHAYTEATQLLERTLWIAGNLSGADREHVEGDVHSELEMALASIEGTRRQQKT